MLGFVWVRLDIFEAFYVGIKEIFLAGALGAGFEQEEF
jgi:hypothetical protein